MAALGNQRAWVHLSDELKQYNYGGILEQLREQVNTTSHEFWENSFYNLWLNAIRALNIETTGDEYPEVMWGEAWADKTLHTQLASWAQLRHDNILYAKPPYSAPIICEYPAGYVEPYPAFYAALQDYARFGQKVFSEIDLGTENPILNYFRHLETVMARLESLSHKEMRHEPFDEDDTLFLRSVTVRKHVVDDRSYGGMSIETWDGWYSDLIPFYNKRERLPQETVTDLHTNYNTAIGVPGVLHIGTREVATLVMQVNDTLYVGPAFTYYEQVETGLPPHRLTDDEWDRRFSPHYFSMFKMMETHLDAITNPEERAKIEARITQTRAEYERELTLVPQPPQWTSSFALYSDAETQQHLSLMSAHAEFMSILSDGLRDKFDAIREKSDTGWGIFRVSLGDVAQMVKTQPEIFLEIEGVDEAMVEELRQALIVKGHLREG